MTNSTTPTDNAGETRDGLSAANRTLIQAHGGNPGLNWAEEYPSTLNRLLNAARAAVPTQQAVVSEGLLTREVIAAVINAWDDTLNPGSLAYEDIEARLRKDPRTAALAQGAGERLKPTPLTDLPAALAAYQARCDEMDAAPPPSSAGEA